MRGMEPERGLKLSFSKNRSKLTFILFLCFLHYSFVFDAQRTFVTL
jgi:hypothetical protein